MSVLRITDESTRSDIAEALAHMCHRATREMPAVGNDEHPTPWDKRHAALNDLLDDYERAH